MVQKRNGIVGIRKKLLGKLLLLLSFIFSTLSYSLSLEEKKILLNETKYHLGTKYLYGARAGNTNRFDCSSLMLYLYKQIGINLPRTSKEQSKLGYKVSLNDLDRGDLLFFNTKGTISHVGMYIGDNKFVHASSAGKRVMVSEIKGYYKKKLVLAKRIGNDIEMEIKKEIIKNTKRINEIAFIKNK